EAEELRARATQRESSLWQSREPSEERSRQACPADLGMGLALLVQLPHPIELCGRRRPHGLEHEWGKPGRLANGGRASPDRGELREGVAARRQVRAQAGRLVTAVADLAPEIAAARDVADPPQVVV